MKKLVYRALEPRYMFDGALAPITHDLALDSLNKLPTESFHDDNVQSLYLFHGNTAFFKSMEQSTPDQIQDETKGNNETENTRELIFIDGKVDNLQQLLNQIDDAKYDIHVLNSNSDGLDQILNYLDKETGAFDAIHIISHGESGFLSLGNSNIDQDHLNDNADDWASLGSYLTNDGDLLLYACELGALSEGQSFVNDLAIVTGADVTASDDITSSSNNWDLEVTSGTIETKSLSIESFNLNLNVLGVNDSNSADANTSVSDNVLNNDNALASGGGYVVVWDSANQDGSGQGIYFKLFDSTGNLISTDDILVNQTTEGPQTDPQVNYLPNGNFLITWESSGDIYGRVFDNAGSAVNDEFLINQHSGGSQLMQVTSLSNGGFVITFTSNDGGRSGQEIHAIIFTPDNSSSSGFSAGSEFTVNTSNAQTQTLSQVAANDGGFTVVWESKNQDGSLEGIYYQYFDNDGNPLFSTDQLVNDTTQRAQTDPQITALGNGSFVISWTSDKGSSSTDIYAKIINADGSSTNSEFLVNTTTNLSQYESSIAPLTNGGFVITWTSYSQDGDVDGVYARMFDASGNPISIEIQANTFTSSEQNNSSVAGLADGGFIVTWDSKNQDSSNDGVYAQQFNSDGSLSGSEYLVNTYSSSNQRDSDVGSYQDAFFKVSDLTVTNIRVGPENGSGTQGIVGQPLQGQFGALTINADGSYSYSANAGVSGIDVFTYTVTDGVNTDTATISITVSSSNSAPTIANTLTNNFTEDSGAAVGDTVATFDAADADDTLTTDSFTLSDTTNYTFSYADGVVTVTLTQAGLDLVNAGTDLPTFTVTVSDGKVSTQASANPSINTIDDLPSTRSDSITVFENTTSTVNVLDGVLANDFDEEGALTVRGFSSVASTTYHPNTGQITPGTERVIGNQLWSSAGSADAGQSITTQFGTMTINSDGSFNYAVNEEYCEQLSAKCIVYDEFIYEAMDSNGNITTESIIVEIRGVNDAVIVTHDTMETTENSKAIGNVLNSDLEIDIDGKMISMKVTGVSFGEIDKDNMPTDNVSVEVKGQYGTLLIEENGDYTYTPFPEIANQLLEGDQITEVFNYVVSDAYSSSQ